MLAAIACSVLLGSVVFVEQDIHGLVVGPADRFSGHVAGNFVHTDIDADGAPDLVLPSTIYLQRNNDFPEEARMPWPEQAKGGACDIWNGQVYTWKDDQLRAFRWDTSDWTQTLSQSFAVHDPTPESDTLSTDTVPRLARYLYDIDGDGQPEIIVPSAQGAHLYAFRNGAYQNVIDIAILPEPTPMLNAQRLWPSSARGIAYPDRELFAHIVVVGSNIVGLWQQPLDSATIRFGQATCPVRVIDGAWAKDQVVHDTSAELPQGYIMCRLNSDGKMDFVRERQLRSHTTVLRKPLYEMAVSLDGGTTTHTIRSSVVAPHCWFVDIDGDGDHDLITEHSGLLDGGTREAVGRALTSTRVSHELRIQLQGSDKKFTSSSLVARTTLRMDVPAALGELGVAGRLRVTGDLNGDGLKDLVVWERSDTLAVYLQEEGTFSTTACNRINVGQFSRFALVDIDDDKRSDIVIYGPDSADAGIARVLFAREDTAR